MPAVTSSEPEAASPGRLLLLSNRLPITIKRSEDGTYTFSMSSGGLVTGLSAAAAGAVAAAVTTPTDVVKTRMMLAAGGREDPASSSAGSGREARLEDGGGKRRRGQSGFEVARQVVREKGVKGLFRGGMLRATWTALGSGIYLGSYEAAKRWLKGGGERDDDLF